MPIYNAPIRDMKFILHDVLKMSQYSNLSTFEDLDPDVINAFLEESGKFSRDILTPLNRVGDINGCIRHDDGSVQTPRGFKKAYQLYCENGFGSLAKDVEFGGQGMPFLLQMAISEMMVSANIGFSAYPGLSSGAWSAIHAAASESQKKHYLPKMTSGQWTGTMNLTEPQCGTDLGLIKTKAVKHGDGSYRISGQKIWISSGEHDLAENIIHLVLARIEDAPNGIKGISLFVVPKFLINEDSSLGERNAVSCGGLEDKMGLHGNSTCVMNYDGATGYLVGEENKGLKGMFVMMNEARLSVGMQGYALSEAAYQNALGFAKERRQGRALTGAKSPEHSADNILVHPDVRRMLMDVKCFIEGARMLTYWAALKQDIIDQSGDEQDEQKANDHLSLLTPVIKSYFTDMGVKATIDAQQVLGGSGYCEEWGMSQFVRDVRITAIYEGTNGVQALDLIGRKLRMEGGRYWQSYFAELDSVIAERFSSYVGAQC